MLRYETGGDDNIILFFYDVNDNEESLRMGDVLDALVRSDSSVVVFSFDREFVKEPLLNLVKEHYGIEYSPSLIVNFETKFEGFISLVELKESLK